ncbi:MAG: ASPIC/UnbV domain-containing protein [Candidatus Poribacteria bacterium]|nr:ASPIC/UnbV domain-containing protein [Candidatus Poribacteria bacterium]
MIGDQSNQDAIGATAVVTTRGGKQQGIVRGGGSYASQSEYTLTFGLGHLTEAQSVEIVFPSGRRETLRSVEANQLVEVTEGRGITNRIGLKRAITASAQR